MEGEDEWAATVAGRSTDGPQHTYSILLVEDDNVTLKAVETILRVHGHYRVTTAMSVAQALQRVKEARDKGQPLFDIILTDLCLPEVSGLQLIHDITDIPVVVMSCQDSQVSVLQAFEAGAAGYLIKPIRKNEVSTLWQHIWRNNRCKVASQAGALPAKANDSGNSTCTGQAGQSTQQDSSRPCEPGAQHPSTPPANPLQQHHVEPERSLCEAQPCSSSGSQLGHLGTVVVEPGSGVERAAIHLDLPVAGISDIAATSHPAGIVQPGEHAAEAAEQLQQDDDSPADAAEVAGMPSAGSSGAVSSPVRETDAAADTAVATTAGPEQIAPKGLQPLSRPQASVTDRYIQHLPPGLQELANLGQQRQHQETGSQVPSLWQPHSAKSQSPAQAQPHSHIAAETAQQPLERAASGLNHSCGSAFTAVTVFLPRSASAAQARAQTTPVAGTATDLGRTAAPSALPPAPALAIAPQQRQPYQAPAAIPGTDMSIQQQQPPQHLARAPSASLGHGSEGPYMSAPPTVALPAGANMWSMPLLPCHMPSTAHAQASALNQMQYLPQSVVQLISALSRRTADQQPVAAGACSVQPADGSQWSKNTHRQAAVAKYMEKRKNRSFQKKVRYESRKRLAESRPRVKGQFVKQGSLPVAKEAQAPAVQAAAATQDGSGKASNQVNAAAGMASNKRVRPFADDDDEAESEEHVSDTEP